MLHSLHRGHEDSSPVGWDVCINSTAPCGESYFPERFGDFDIRADSQGPMRLLILTISGIWIPPQKVFAFYITFVCIGLNIHELGAPAHGQYIAAVDMQVAEAFQGVIILARARITGPVIVATLVYVLIRLPQKNT